jgi:hypothetical protein
MRRARWETIGLTAVCLVACGAQTTDDAGVGAVRTKEQVVEASTQVAKAFCGALGSCCEMRAYPFDEPGCAATMRDQLAESLITDRSCVPPPPTDADVQRCADAVRAKAAQCQSEDPDSGGLFSSVAILDACHALVHKSGSVALGDLCQGGCDCAYVPGKAVSCVEPAECIAGAAGSGSSAALFV